MRTVEEITGRMKIPVKPGLNGSKERDAPGHGHPWGTGEGLLSRGLRHVQTIMHVQRLLGL